MRIIDLLETVFGNPNTSAWYVFSEPKGKSIVTSYLETHQTPLPLVGLDIPLERQLATMDGHFAVITVQQTTNVLPRNVSAKGVLNYMMECGETEHDTDYTLGYVSPAGHEDLRQHLLRRLRTRKRVPLPANKPGALFSCVAGEVVAQVFLGTRPLPRRPN